MTRFFTRFLISLVLGWLAGVETGIALAPESNLAPLAGILVMVPLTYLASFLVVPLLSGWLDRLR
ncbi:MAG: hypothetical protein QE284_19670 [Rhizobium sp.]|nr:hypothetical protein [Rhizobium sp.]